jgi:hypothetical protein
MDITSEVGLQWVRLSDALNRLSSSHFKNLSILHVGIADCAKLKKKTLFWIGFKQRNA